jgi:spermidine synthase
MAGQQTRALCDRGHGRIKRKQDMASKKKIQLPEVNFSDYGDTRYLHLGTPWVQGSMNIDKPFDIDLEYVQRMMAWLLFVDIDKVSKLHAMQLGLGAASLTKFCFKHLRMTSTAIELNPQVIAACRLWFKLPADSAKLHVVLGDAAEVAQHDHWRGQIDALQVDLYDHEAASPVLDSADFYADCRSLLTDEGCMTVNLFGRSSSFEQSLAKMAQAFGEDALWAFKPTREGNTVVLAQRTPKHPKRAELMARAEAIQARWPLPATKWLRVFKPLKA